MRKHTVIVADDNEDIRRKLAEMLAPEYDIVATVENGEQLVEAATALKPDLVVIDVSMPVLNGLDALQRLMLLGTGAKAIMVSTNANPAYVNRAFQIGAVAYVVKGAGVEDLPVALTAVLNGQTFISPGIHLDGLTQAQRGKLK